MTQIVDRSVSALVDRETVDYLARAKAVALVVEQEAEAIERDATITKPVYEALTEAELFPGNRTERPQHSVPRDQARADGTQPHPRATDYHSLRSPDGRKITPVGELQPAQSAGWQASPRVALHNRPHHHAVSP